MIENWENPALDFSAAVAGLRPMRFSSYKFGMDDK